MTKIDQLVRHKAAEGISPDHSLPKPRMDVILNTVKDIPLDIIKPDTEQPRKTFDETSLASLATSIKEKGLIQPIILKPQGQEYLILAGHRRYYAYQRLGLKSIPAIIREQTASAKDLTELALIENLQREDLNTMEIAESIFKLKSLKDVSQDEISKITGYSQSNVSKYIQLHEMILKHPNIAEKVKSMGFKRAYERYCLSSGGKPTRKPATPKHANEEVFVIEISDKTDQAAIKKAISQAEYILKELNQMLESTNYSR